MVAGRTLETGLEGETRQECTCRIGVVMGCLASGVKTPIRQNTLGSLLTMAQFTSNHDTKYSLRVLDRSRGDCKKNEQSRGKTGTADSDCYTSSGRTSPDKTLIP
jgi:hypothetical protein